MKCLLIEGGIIPGFNFHPVTQAGGYHSFCAHPNIFVSSIYHARPTDGAEHVSMQSALFPHAHVCLWAAREEEEEEEVEVVEERRSGKAPHRLLEPSAD